MPQDGCRTLARRAAAPRPGSAEGPRAASRPQEGRPRGCGGLGGLPHGLRVGAPHVCAEHTAEGQLELSAQVSSAPNPSPRAFQRPHCAHGLAGGPGLLREDPRGSRGVRSSWSTSDVLTAWESSAGNARAGTQELPRHPQRVPGRPTAQPATNCYSVDAKEAFFKNEAKF